MVRLRVASLIAALALLVPGSALAAVTKNLLVTHVQQPNDRSCVATSSLMAVKRIDPSRSFPAIDVVDKSRIDPATLHGVGSAHKYCWANSNDPAHDGLDPLAWAWILYTYTPGGFLYDDFTYTTAYSGTAAMIYQLYDYNDVAGALVNRGHHAFVFQGATTSCSPTVDTCGFTISTVYVDDPWYHRSGPAHSPGQGSCAYTCGKINLAPNRAIDYTTWKSYYYTTWGSQDCSHWDGKFVSVLRKASGVPSAASSVQIKDSALGPDREATPGRELAEPVSQSQIVAASQDVDAIDAAFARAVDHGGLRERKELNEALDGGHVTHLSRVRSLIKAFPDYLLASVVGKGGLKGVAMFTLEGSKPAFGGMTTSETAMSRYPFLTADVALTLVREAGSDPTGSAELVWGWSRQSESPYYPLYQVQTQTGVRYVDQFGEVFEGLELESDAR